MYLRIRAQIAPEVSWDQTVPGCIYITARVCRQHRRRGQPRVVEVLFAAGRLDSAVYSLQAARPRIPESF